MNPKDYLVTPGISSFTLTNWDPNDTGGLDSKAEGKGILKGERKRIRNLQARLFAEGKQSLLVIVQATDTGGKDGAIKKVFKGVNQQGVRVWSFKEPTQRELDHDFLWRYHKKTPSHSMITVFNRSQYEEVLVVRVNNLVPGKQWSEYYDLINVFEKTLAVHGTRILKFYLHISRDEQKRRFQARLDEPDKNWKFSSGDLEEREHWDDYQTAFEEAISRCSTDHAPWFVIPANRKWYRDALISRIVADTLEEMNPQFPEPEPVLDKIIIPD